MWFYNDSNRFVGNLVQEGRFVDDFLSEESRLLYVDSRAEIIRALWCLDVGRQELEEAGLVNNHDKIELSLIYRDRLERLEEKVAAVNNLSTLKPELRLA